MTIRCPFGSGNIDLRNRKLTLREKQWIANQFMNGTFSSKELHIKYKIPYSKLHKYVQKVQFGGILYDNAGRPRKLDDISLRVLRQKIIANENMSENELRDLIRDEYRAGLRRAYPDEAANLLRKRKALSYKTVVKYARELRDYARDSSDSE